MNKVNVFLFTLFLFIIDSSFAGKKIHFVKNPFHHDQSKVLFLKYFSESETSIETFFQNIFEFNQINSSHKPDSMKIVPINNYVTNVDIRYYVDVYEDTFATSCADLRKTLNVKTPTYINQRAGIISEITYQLLSNSCEKNDQEYPSGYYIRINAIQSHMYENSFKGTCTDEGGINDHIEIPVIIYFSVHFQDIVQKKEVYHVTCKLTDNYYPDDIFNDNRNQIFLDSTKCVGMDGYLEKLKVKQAFRFPQQKEISIYDLLPGLEIHMDTLANRYMSSKNSNN